MRSHPILYDITCIVSWHHSLYIWHYIHSVSSRPMHQLYHTKSLYDITHTLVWHLSQYVWQHMNTLWHHTRIGMTSHTVYLWHHNNIYMISTLQLSWKHNDTWHHTHYMWHHSHCICPATPGSSIDHNSLGSYPTWHTYDIIHTLHDITITLYDITPQFLWHHSHCIHDIIYPT